MTKNTSRTTQKTIKALELCSKCLTHEVNSWINENWKLLNEETKKQIREEIKTVKLKAGTCIVCENKNITDRTSERILEILEENKSPEKLKKDFEKDFCLIE